MQMDEESKRAAELLLAMGEEDPKRKIQKMVEDAIRPYIGSKASPAVLTAVQNNLHNLLGPLTSKVEIISDPFGGYSVRIVETGELEFVTLETKVGCGE